MSFRQLSAALAVATALAMPSVAVAQTAWSVLITPTLNPLPIGLCGAIQLKLTDPATKDTPRNPAGYYVTMADVDLTVTGPSTAAQQIDASHWSACACQGGAAGTVGTVTVTYPAQSLLPQARVAGVSFSKTATFALGAQANRVNPPACALAAGQRIAAAPTAPPPSPPPAAPLAAPPPATSAAAPGNAPPAPVPVAGGGGRTPTPAATSPVPVNPSGFTAVQTGTGQVDLSWQPVSGVSYYVVFGPGSSAGGVKVPTDTTYRVTGVPNGRQQWSVASYYTPGPVSTPASAFPTATVNMVPPHTIAWLSKANGPGSAATATAHYESLCPYQSNGIRPTNCPPEIMIELNNVPGLLNAAGALSYTAVYGNTEDLGFGRRTTCGQWAAPPPAFLSTLCYTRTHGPGPGEPGFADPQVITAAAMQKTDQRTFTIITKDATGMRFLVFGPEGGGGGYGPGPSPYILLDSEGQKFAPHTCLACHGGTYNPATKRVTGASLLPLNPYALVYSGGPAGRAAQEESIRKINQIVVSSVPSVAVAQYINGLYGGKVAVAGTKAIDDFVPQGWSAQPGLYRSVVRPYCSSCHLAAQPSYSFASWSNFQGNAALIRAAVCSIHSMPHSELQFKDFWSKSPGVVYLPGMLAASLGYPSC